MRIYLSISLFVLFSIVSILILVQNTHKKAFHFVCSQVYEKSIGDVNALKEWSVDCIKNAQSFYLFESRKALMNRIESELRKLSISHLHVYSPVEGKEIWEGKVKENGLRLRAINGLFIVNQVIKESPAEKSGILPGDVVLSINGHSPQTKWFVRSSSGSFFFKRSENIIEKELSVKEIIIDESPSLNRFGNNVGWLKISSFRQEYFDKKNWKNLVEKMGSYSKLIIDLRDNRGGDFVAYLRALSPFFCKPTEVGHLQKRKRRVSTSIDFKDRMTDEDELHLVYNYERINLKTYENYGCYKKPVKVLVNTGTGSVAEMFAEAMLARASTKVWGENTAGEVVLAVFYTLPQLGVGYSLSIPEANYFNINNESIEGVGVIPQKWLNYELNETLLGKDSWLLRALQ